MSNAEKKTIEKKEETKMKKSLENARKEKEAARKELHEAEATAKADNSRKNRKALQAARKNYARKLEHFAQLSGNVAVEDIKIFDYPLKRKTMNVPLKTKTFKAKIVPGKAHAAVNLRKGKIRNWETEKAERRALRANATPIVKKTPNKGMADATEEYAIACCWEELLAGNENAREALKALVPNNGTETTEPRKEDSEMFYAEKARIRKLEESLAYLPVEFQRLSKNADSAKARFDSIHKRVGVAKMMATKANKAYINASEDDKAAKYKVMMAKKQYAASVAILDAEARKEYAFRQRQVADFADLWDREEERLNTLMEKAIEKLNNAHLAYVHNKREKALEEAFSMRYERGEHVPEKTDPDRYKVYAVKPMALYGAEMHRLLQEMETLYATKTAGWLLQGKALFRQFVGLLQQKRKYIVDIRDCVVNNVSRSKLSDIMGIEYGQKSPCKEIISVTYDAMSIKVYYKFMADDYNKAQERLHKVREQMIKNIMDNGVQLVLKDQILNDYDLLASNQSQQKKGQCYMGETKTMKLAEKALEFCWEKDKAIAERPDNSAEYLKRIATLMTPSKVITNKDGKTVDLTRILMVNDCEIERMFDNVTTISGKKLSKAEKKKMKITMFDGQALWLKDGFVSTQGRGYGLKYMAIAKPDYKLPEFAKDIMGNIVRVADYDILMSKSCWKAAKMGWNWYQFRDEVMKLSEEFPGIELLESVRYSDKEIGDEENPRNLARQATQQWVTMPEEDIEKLTRKTRRWLNSHKSYWKILAKLGEWNLPVNERSAFAHLINKVPQLIVHPYIKQWLKNWWTAKRDKACSGRIRTEGMYPYIAQDPIAMIQIFLEGRDPNEEGLGVLKAGEVNLPKVKDGQKVYAIRYPANYMVGMVMMQVNVDAFRNIGNVAVLPYYGEAIVRADGDFDGDEMLFILNALIIATMERIIEEYHPTLIDFPHGKVRCDHPFSIVIEDVLDKNGNKIDEIRKSVDGLENFKKEITNALVRAQEYNLVGLYSNLAVICLQNASIASNPLERAKWLNAAKYAHVGAIVCLDMVKGADIPEELKAKLEEMNTAIRKNHKMPWNQLFSHSELTPADVEKRSNSTQDKIAGKIYDDCGEFEIEFEDCDPVSWDDSILSALAPERMTVMHRWIVGEDDLARLRGCHFEDICDKETWRRMESGEDIGLKDWALLGWHNASAIVWKMTGADMAEKRNELNKYIRDVAIANVRDNEWSNKDGKSFGLVDRYKTFVNEVVRLTFGKNGIDDEKKGSFAIFMLRVFAKDILFAFENAILDEDAVAEMCVRVEKFDRAPAFMEDDEDASVLDDGSMYLGSVCEDDDCPQDDYIPDYAEEYVG